MVVTGSEFLDNARISDPIRGFQPVFPGLTQSEGIIDMTVQELIEKLQEIEDKSRICLVEDSTGDLWEIKPGGTYSWVYEGSNAIVFS